MVDSPDELYLIGRIASAFGMRGQVKMRAITDRPDHIESHVRQVYLGAHLMPYLLLDLFEHKPGLLVLTFQGISTREQAEELRNTEVFIRASDAAPLDEGEYYLHHLYSLRVETVEGDEIGQVREVLETGSNEVLVVARPGQSDALIPMIRDVVQELDIAGGRVVIRLLEGLL
jgi:16S rRNA processing protein RimM